VHEIREEHLTSRVRVGTDNDPNHSKEGDGHWGEDILETVATNRIANP